MLNISIYICGLYSPHAYTSMGFNLALACHFHSHHFAFFTYCILRCWTSNSRLAHKHETQINDRYLCANTCISPKHWRTHAARAHAAAVHIHSFRNLLVFVSLLVFFFYFLFFHFVCLLYILYIVMAVANVAQYHIHLMWFNSACDAIHFPNSVKWCEKSSNEM